MVCKLCGTPLGEGERICPNCGHVLKGPGRQGDRGRDKERDTGRGRGAAATVEGADVEVAEPAGTGPPAPTIPESPPRASESAPKGPEAPSPVFALDPAGLRRLLARQPDLLEPGLGVLADDKGKLIGVGYPTPVGDIDLLARDRSGSLVVVRVASRGQGEELVAETLQRMGWVRKHLGKGKQKVRGIVLMEYAPDNLSYTAAAVAGTMAFKTYRVAVAFDDVEI